jgi:serine/threonine protein kinase
MLGQGGNGTVFLGILPNGKNVAVKRLVFNTRDWVEEFFNEVNLISGIQHKNLVKLLGCSIEGPESLLVYEYVPNKSLDQFLFGNKFSLSLSLEHCIVSLIVRLCFCIAFYLMFPLIDFDRFYHKEKRPFEQLLKALGLN